MSIVFRTTDGTKWGAGKGGDLTPTEVDLNFWELLARIVELESEPPEAVSIDHFSVAGSQLTVWLTDGTSKGPYTLPTAKFTLLGDWEPDTVYPANVFVVNEDTTYLIEAPHTSAATFDPGANNGAGVNYYSALPFPVDKTYDVGFFFPGIVGLGVDTLGDGTICARIFSRATWLPAGLALSVATLQNPPTDALAFPIFKNTLLIGSLNFAAGDSDGTFTFTTNVQFAAGDRLRVALWDGDAPTGFAVDATATDLAVNFVAKKGTP